MTIHGLCVVKNEADIIEQTLLAAAEWCDRIYVLDNGSGDGTWEKVGALARAIPAVTPYKQDPRPFDDGIRNDIFRHFAGQAKRGDWWCILDADEFYIDDPRRFLSRVPQTYHSVWMQLYTYLFTDKDLEAYKRQPDLYGDHVPIEQKLRYYVVGDYTEQRFFRHANSLSEIPSGHAIYPERIRMKHFAYRSPEQIRRRLATRQEPMERGEFLHEKRANWVPGGVILPGPARPEDIPRSWEERVTPSAECHFDRGDGNYAEAGPWVPPQGPTWAARLRSRVSHAYRRLVPAKEG
jgi:hypothetical protein